MTRDSLIAIAVLAQTIFHPGFCFPVLAKGHQQRQVQSHWKEHSRPSLATNAKYDSVYSSTSEMPMVGMSPHNPNWNQTQNAQGYRYDAEYNAAHAAWERDHLVAEPQYQPPSHH